MTQRPDRQPEDIDSPLHPAADPDLEDGTEVSRPVAGKTDAGNTDAEDDEPAPHDHGPSS